MKMPGTILEPNFSIAPNSLSATGFYWTMAPKWTSLHLNSPSWRCWSGVESLSARSFAFRKSRNAGRRQPNKGAEATRPQCSPSPLEHPPNGSLSDTTRLGSVGRGNICRHAHCLACSLQLLRSVNVSTLRAILSYELWEGRCCGVSGELWRRVALKPRSKPFLHRQCGQVSTARRFPSDPTSQCGPQC